MSAGTFVKIPSSPLRLNESIGGGGCSGGDDRLRVYVVSPADHVGKVSSGIILLGDEERMEEKKKKEDKGGNISTSSFSCCAFADYLAGIGYVILVPVHFRSRSEIVEEQITAHLDDYCIPFLQEEWGIETMALIGFGPLGRIAWTVANSASHSRFQCVVAVCPTSKMETLPCVVPSLCIIGTLNGHCDVADLECIQLEPLGRLYIADQEKHAFCYRNIENEDAATQAIAVLLDWLAIYLHQYQLAACTSDTDPWWPQGRNGPFMNIGRHHWLTVRQEWNTETHTSRKDCLKIGDADKEMLQEILSSTKVFDLDKPVALQDIVDLLIGIWE